MRAASRRGTNGAVSFKALIAEDTQRRAGSRIEGTNRKIQNSTNQQKEIIMGLFNTLMTKIFSHASSAAPATASGSAPASAPASAPVTQGSPASAMPAPSAVGMPAAATAPNTPAASAPPAQAVDVAATLDRLAAQNSEKLDWKHSIVDLMKLVGMDSSLSARKELAQDLHYSGDVNDSAAMNIWLHKEVMQKLAANGAKIPQDLLNK